MLSWSTQSSNWFQPIIHLGQLLFTYIILSNLFQPISERLLCILKLLLWLLTTNGFIKIFILEAANVIQLTRHKLICAPELLKVFSSISFCVSSYNLLCTFRIIFHFLSFVIHHGNLRNGKNERFWRMEIFRAWNTIFGGILKFLELLEQFRIVQMKELIDAEYDFIRSLGIA